MFQKICIAKINLEFTDECVEQKKNGRFCVCVCVCSILPVLVCIYFCIFFLFLTMGRQKKKEQILKFQIDGGTEIVWGGRTIFDSSWKKEYTLYSPPPSICIFKIHSFPPFSWISNHVLHPTFSHWHSMFVRFVSILTPPIRLFFYFLLTSPLSFPS